MTERCVCCGAIIPEGQQTCPSCKKGVRKMAELKTCPYCEDTPVLQMGIVFQINEARYRYHCPRCHITGKSCYTIEGAIEAWNRRVEDGK